MHKQKEIVTFKTKQSFCWIIFFLIFVLTSELFRPEVFLIRFRAILPLELKACDIKRTPKLTGQGVNIGYRRFLLADLYLPLSPGACSLASVWSSISPALSFTVAADLLSPLHELLPLSQATWTSVCFLLPSSSPLLAWGCSSGWEVPICRQRLTCAPASTWENRMRPEASIRECVPVPPHRTSFWLCQRGHLLQDKRKGWVKWACASDLPRGPVALRLSG